MAVAHGNRTHRGRLSAPATGFEDRASHQIRKRYRGRSYSEIRRDAPRFWVRGGRCADRYLFSGNAGHAQNRARGRLGEPGPTMALYAGRCAALSWRLPRTIGARGVAEQEGT